MENRDLICIGCPLGCTVRVTTESGKVMSVQGNGCSKGETYARKEVTSPTRIVTSTVFVKDGTEPVVSVKTSTDIPKDKIFAIIRSLKGVEAQAPIKIGDVIVKNAENTGADIISTANVPTRVQ